MGKVTKENQREALQEIERILQQHSMTHLQMLETLEMAKHYCAGSNAVIGWEGLKSASGNGALDAELAINLLE